MGTRQLHTVGEVARLARVTVRTLHHYDRIGLLVLSGRSENGYRLYAYDDRSCPRHMVEEPVAQSGRLHILVNNAGLGVVKRLAEMSTTEWQLQVDMNPGGVFYSSNAALPRVVASGDGFIVNTASPVSRHAFRDRTGNNASKFGLLSLTEADDAGCAPRWRAREHRDACERSPTLPRPGAGHGTDVASARRRRATAVLRFLSHRREA